MSFVSAQVRCARYRQRERRECAASIFRFGWRIYFFPSFPFSSARMALEVNREANTPADEEKLKVSFFPMLCFDSAIWFFRSHFFYFSQMCISLSFGVLDEDDASKMKRVAQTPRPAATLFTWHGTRLPKIRMKKKKKKSVTN